MNKKVFLGLLGSVISPLTVAFCVSCETRETEKVNLIIPFVQSHEKKAFNAISTLVDKFNRSLDNKYLNNKINIRNVFDKKKINYKVNLEMNIKDSRTPSLVISYPSIVPLIHNNNRLFDLTEIAKKSKIKEKILDFNNRLGFNNKNKIYSLPIGISSEIFIVNKKLLSYVLYSLYEFNKKENINNKYISNLKKSPFFANLILNYENLNKNNEIILFNKEQLKAWNLKLDEDILNYDDNFNYFIELLNKSMIDKKQLDILFIKHIENYLFENLFKKSDSNFSNFFLKYDENQKINYDNIFKKDSKENIEFKNEISSFYNKLKNNILYIEANKNLNIKNSKNQLFTFITSRAYEFNYEYFLENKNDLLIKNVPLRRNKTQEKGSFFMQGLFVSAIKSDIKEKNEVIQLFLNWLYNSENKLEWVVNNKKTILTPIEYLSFALSYVFPTENFVKENNKIFEANIANQLLLENIFDDNLVPLTDLVDDRSAKLRENIKILVTNYLLTKAKENASLDQVVNDFLVKLEELIK
ncbi:extracellular solute-binding protein [Mycoplasmopsis arginini]|uniref:extracellular solute-binding protein n=1 Tax=Mycoplasmopsis arginini TaxID=2094 RepID=UPI0002D14E7A|nr:extracellular solute-binding protein [Mycoplasmopsis arginini]ENY69914.1 Hypothetical protein MARG_1440 [Mycoplasmopsis arginini 7264]BAQ54669.1 hypothetical protein MARG145_0766 [Mycoplasmopsis arginini]